MGSRRRPKPRKRAAALGACMLLALVPACAAAPAAMARGFEGAFNELNEKAQQPTAPTQRATSTTGTASTESTSSSSTGTMIVLASGVAIVLLVGIGYVIFRDARKVAPAGDGQLAEVTGARRPATRLHKRRAQAKAARRQRKRNR